MAEPFRLCACGCGERVKRHSCRFASPQCVPYAMRVTSARASRKAWTYNQRAVKFRADLAQLEGHITREDLLALMMKVYRRAYLSGYKQRQTREVIEAAGMARGAA